MRRNPLVLLLPSVALAADMIPFPATLEIDVVFPRNDTYAVVAPFPVVFAFQNAAVFFGFAGQFSWELTCKNGSLTGRSNLQSEETPPPAEPFFYVNISRPLNQVSNILKEPNPEPFPFWRGNSDTCTLNWALHYYSNCTVLPDGRTLIEGGTFKDQKGSLNFTIAPGAKIPADTLGAYPDCPIYGGSVQVASNITTCPHIGSDPAAPNPCGIKFGSVAASVVAQIPTPTITFTPAATQSGASKTSGTSGTPTPTGGAGDGGKGAASRTLAEGGVLAGLLMVLGAFGAMLLF